MSITQEQVQHKLNYISFLIFFCSSLIFGKKSFEQVRCILELLVAAQRPIKTKHLHAALTLKQKNISLEEVERRIKLFGPLLVLKKHGWIPIHNSFLAWCQGNVVLKNYFTIWKALCILQRINQFYDHNFNHLIQMLNTVRRGIYAML